MLQPMYEAINEKEAIVFSSPIYYYQITGQTNVWLETSASVSANLINKKYPSTLHTAVHHAYPARHGSLQPALVEG